MTKTRLGHELDRLRATGAAESADKRASLAATIERAYAAYYAPGERRGTAPQEPPAERKRSRRGNVPRGIPTVYNGVQFRSRTEARWAAFFDLCGWQWDYEPIDLDGYIPDFALRFSKTLLVEVKGDVGEEALWHQLIAGGVRQKIMASGWTDEVLLVGAGPWSQNHRETGCIGLLRERDWGDDEWGSACFQVCDACKRMTVFNVCTSYRCRASGCGDGEEIYTEEAGDMPLAQRLWREAGNRTQWKSPRGNP